MYIWMCIYHIYIDSYGYKQADPFETSLRNIPVFTGAKRSQKEGTWSLVRAVCSYQETISSDFLERGRAQWIWERRGLISVAAFDRTVIMELSSWSSLSQTALYANCSNVIPCPKLPQTGTLPICAYF